jgi:hypothetical protein
MQAIGAYLRSGWVRAGLTLLIFGTGPLLGFILYAKLGFHHDPNPNPVALGIPAMLTFWPSILMIAWGVWRVRRDPPAP